MSKFSLVLLSASILFLSGCGDESKSVEEHAPILKLKSLKKRFKS